MVARRLGAWSATVMVLIGVAYVVTLVIGIVTYGMRPIADPVLAVMEVLTLMAAPTVVVLMVAIHGVASQNRGPK